MLQVMCEEALCNGLTVENVSDVLILRHQYDSDVEAAENDAHYEALNVNPEDLSAVPSVPEIVD